MSTESLWSMKREGENGDSAVRESVPTEKMSHLRQNFEEEIKTVLTFLI